MKRFEIFKTKNIHGHSSNSTVQSILYPNNEHTEIRETPKTKFVDLISNLGGSLGIFLGFSIFSFGLNL